jgi:hypothetical protein
MDRIILSINTQKLKNETHVQFNGSADSLFVKFDPQALAIAPLYMPYRNALNDETEALDFIRKSEFTQKIHDQDYVRDDIFRGFRDSLKGATRHFDPQRREAAEMLLNIFNHYGNIARKSLDDETAAINDINRELNMPSNAGALNLLGMTEWQSKLVEENALFTELMAKRYSESAGKTPLRMITARAKTDKFYHAIIAQLENQNLAGITLNEAFIKELNAVIARFRNILAQEIAERKPKPTAGNNNEK